MTLVWPWLQFFFYDDEDENDWRLLMHLKQPSRWSLSLPDLDKSRTGCCILEGFRSSWFSFCCSFMIIFIWAHDGYQAFLKCTANWLCLNKVIDEHIVTKFFQQICNWIFSYCWWNKGVLFQFENLSFFIKADFRGLGFLSVGLMQFFI